MRRLLPLFLVFRLAAGCLLENGMSSVYLSVFEDAPTGKFPPNFPIPEGAVTIFGQASRRLALITALS